MTNFLKYKLTIDQQQLIKKIFNQNSNVFKIKNDYMIVDEKKRDIVINTLNSYFLKKGLEKNFEPNALGEKLENLLDLFLEK